MKKRREPEANVEYTFKFRSGEKVNVVTLIFEGTNAKGRFEFYNKQSKGFTSMPPERFSYIMRFNLVSQKPIEKKPSISEVWEQEEEKRKGQEEKEALEREKAFNKDLLEKFGSLNAYQRAQVEHVTSTTYDDFYKDLKKFASLEQLPGSFIEEMFAKILKASNILNIKLKEL